MTMLVSRSASRTIITKMMFLVIAATWSIVFVSSCNTVYVTNNRATELASIDVDTGTVSNLGAFQDATGIGTYRYWSMAVDRTSNILHGISEDHNISVFDPNNGYNFAVSTLSGFEDDTTIYTNEFDSKGTMYVHGHQDETLYKIDNIATGVVTKIGLTGIDDVGDMAMHGDGTKLYVASGEAPGLRIHIVKTKNARVLLIDELQDDLWPVETGVGSLFFDKDNILYALPYYSSEDDEQPVTLFRVDMESLALVPVFNTTLSKPWGGGLLCPHITD